MWLNETTWVMGATAICGMIMANPHTPLQERYRDATQRFCRHNAYIARRSIATPTIRLTSFELESDASLEHLLHTGTAEEIWTGTRLQETTSRTLTQSGHFATATLQGGKSLLLSEDATGICPLYYCNIDNAMIFSSSLEFLLLCQSSVHIDAQSLHAITQYGAILNGQTLYRGMYRLPANIVQVSFAGQQLLMQPVRPTADTPNLCTITEKVPTLTSAQLTLKPEPTQQACAFLSLPGVARRNAMPISNYWECLITSALRTHRAQCLRIPLGQNVVKSGHDDFFTTHNPAHKFSKGLTTRMQDWLNILPQPRRDSENVHAHIRQQLHNLLGRIATHCEVQAYISIRYQWPVLAQRLSRHAREQGTMLVFPWLSTALEQLLIGSPEQIAVMLQHHTPLQSPDLEHHFSYTACSPINLYDAAQRLLRTHRQGAAVRQYFPIGALQLSRCFASAKYRINGEASSIATFLLTLDYLDTIFHFNTTSPHRLARKRVSNQNTSIQSRTKRTSP